jgi:hypothetical protein
LKVHFHYLFIFKTSIAFCFQIAIVFKQFFHRNIIEKKFRWFIFNCYVQKISLDNSIFQLFFMSVIQQEWKNWIRDWFTMVCS